MSVLKFSFVLFMFLVLTSQFFVVAVVAGVSEDVAASALTDAEEAVTSAYQAVLRGEEAGGDVSSLLIRLNEAGGFLARARMAYDLRDFEEAASLANSSRNIGVEVESAAVNLRDSALSEGLQHMVFTITASVIGVALIALGSFWVWRVFKHRYYGRILKMKPEVSSNES
jgi:hypothetical protein